MDIIYEDDYILIVNKPPGIPVQPDYSGEDSLVNMSAHYLKREVNSIYVINRLDKPVGGIVILAKDKVCAANINKQLSNNTIKKYYYAIVIDEAPSNGVLEDYMVKISRLNVSEISSKNNKNAKLARLSFENKGMLENPEKLSLLNIDLETGRHHQIRLQLSNIGFPVWGDRKYSKNKYSHGENVALFAYKIIFNHPKDGRRLTFIAPFPDKPPFDKFRAMV